MHELTTPLVLVAHRGHAVAWPENTLPALEDAVAAGALWVEVDVQLCAGGVPVLLHDTNLRRIAGRSDSVFTLDADLIRKIPAGEPKRFGDRRADVRLSCLTDFSAWLIAHPHVNAFVELKPESLKKFGRECMLAACLEALGPASAQCVLLSYDFAVLALARDAGFPRLGWVVRHFTQRTASRARKLKAGWLFCCHKDLPPGPLPYGEWHWVLFEISEADTARALIARGARWLETMHYRALAKALLR